MKDSYDTIKKISKKKLKGEALKHVEDTLTYHWSNNIGNLDNFEPVYKVIKDSSRYSFNAPHALAMANDSLYEAWAKAHHPSIFYETTLNHYQEKGNKNKVADLEKEAMTIFGYSIGSYEYGKDNTKFTVDDDTKTIYPNLASVKDIGEKAVEDMVNIYKAGNDNIIDTYLAIKGTKINASVFRKMVKIEYFKKFGTVKKLLQCVGIVEYWRGKSKDVRKTISKDDISKLGLDKIDYLKYVSDKTKSGGQSDKQYRITDWRGLVTALCNSIPNEEFESTQLVNYQYEVLGYVDRIDPKLEWRYVCITNLNKTYSPKFSAYCIQNGKITEMKVHKTIPRNDKRCKVSFKQVPFEEGEIIYIKDCKKEPKKIKVDDEWQIVPDTYEWWIKDYYKVVANEKKEVNDS